MKSKTIILILLLLINSFFYLTKANSYLLSQEKTAVSSSNELSNLNAGNAIDGNIETRWASAEGSDPEWIYVDLGMEASIDRVVLIWETAYGKEYEIQVSNDLNTWTTIYSTSSGNGDIDDISAVGTGRYVRMYGKSRGTQWGYSLWEFKIYGDFPTAAKFMLTTNTIGSGIVNPANGNYSENVWAEIEANAEEGWKFSHWQGDLSGNINPTAIKMDTNKNVTAVFQQITVPENSPVAINGKLNVEGVKLVNQYGNPIQLRGMSTHGIQWYWNNYTDESLDVLAFEWGADILRISMYVQEGGWINDPTGFTNKVCTLIDKASERGMYVLVDWHQLEPPDPNYNLDNAKIFFTDVVTKYKNNINIIYDICNEPSDVSWNRIKEYADEIIPVIREINPDAIITIGTHGWASLGVSDGRTHQDILDNPVEFPNIMYGFHFYAASHQDSYLAELDAASDVLPIFVTEWGTQVYDGDQTNDFDFSQRYVDLMAEKKISWTNWNYSCDHRSGAVWKDPMTGKNNGPWTDDNLKPSGVWIKDKILNPSDDFPTSIYIVPIEKAIPSNYKLNQNYPNPFNPSTNIIFSIPTNGFVKLSIFDTLGREVTNLIKSELNTGTYKILFDASKLNSGVYFYKLECNSIILSKKMLFIK